MSKPTCGQCPFNNGDRYLTTPPFVRCDISKQFRKTDDICNIEFEPIGQAINDRGTWKVSHAPDDGLIHHVIRVTHCRYCDFRNDEDYCMWWEEKVPDDGYCYMAERIVDDR